MGRKSLRQLGNNDIGMSGLRKSSHEENVVNFLTK